MRRSSVVLLAFCVLAPGAARADAAMVVNQHGLVLDAEDKPVESQALLLGFKIFALGAPVPNEAAAIWQGSCSVPVRRGFYSVALGGGSCGTGLMASMLPSGAERYLEVSVDGGVLLPRMIIGTVPSAAVADDARALEGETLAELDDRYAVLLTDVAGPAQVGSLHVDGTVKAAALAGNGSALTHLSAGALEGPLPAGFAAANNMALTTGAQTFDSGVTAASFQTTDGKVALTSTGVALSGGAKFQGNGSLLTNLPAGALAGTLPTGFPAANSLALTTGAQFFDSGVNAQAFLTTGGAVTITNSGVLLTGNAKFQGDGTLLSGVAKTGEANSFTGNIDVTGSIRVGNDSVCTGRAGALRWTTRLEACDGTNWFAVFQPSPLGLSTGQAARNCKAIKDGYPGAPSDVYYLDPTGTGTPIIQAYCDMTSDGGGWTLVANVSAGNASHVASTGAVNLATTGAAVPYEETPDGRKLADATVVAIASEGTIRVSVGVKSSPAYRVFFRLPAGIQNINFTCQGGGSCPRLITSHAYPYVWEASLCKGVTLGYRISDSTNYHVFDNHDNSECGAQWSSSEYSTHRVLYRYPADGNGIFNGRYGYTWVR